MILVEKLSSTKLFLFIKQIRKMAKNWKKQIFWKTVEARTLKQD